MAHLGFCFYDWVDMFQAHGSISARLGRIKGGSITGFLECCLSSAKMVMNIWMGVIDAGMERGISMSCHMVVLSQGQTNSDERCGLLLSKSLWCTTTRMVPRCLRSLVSGLLHGLSLDLLAWYLMLLDTGDR